MQELIEQPEESDGDEDDDGGDESGRRPGFFDADRTWVLEHAATSLAEIEKATLRLVAIRESRNMSDAAARLGMAPVSLSRWIGRRKLPPMGPVT